MVVWSITLKKCGKLRTEHEAQLPFHIQPIILLFCGVVVVVAVVAVEIL